MPPSQPQAPEGSVKTHSDSRLGFIEVQYPCGLSHVPVLLN